MSFLIPILLVFTRVAGVVMTAPILGSRSVPIRIRLALAGLIALAAFPLAIHGEVPTQPAQVVNAVFAEAVVGILLGLGVTIMFAASAAAGAVMAQMAGFQWPSHSTVDPDESGSAVSQLFAIISLAAFALIDGPEMVLGAVLETFRHLPLGTTIESSKIISLLIQLLQQSFLLTLRGVAPAIGAMMLSTIAVGLICRSYPQMNTLGLGLSSNQLVLFLAVFLTLGSCVWLFVDDLDSVIALIKNNLIGHYP